MRAVVVSPYDKRRIVSLIRSWGFVLSKSPEIVFTYGGDGTILQAERQYEGIPIVPVKKSRICSRCHVYSSDQLSGVLKKIRKNRFRIVEREKIEAVFKGRKIYALNEIQVRSKDPRGALRFSVNGVRDEIIGDGLVAATAYGSTGYYRSVGCKPFSRGVRIGFNNVWPRLPCMEVKKCVVRNLRADAWLAADNFFLATMKKGDNVIIRESGKKARFVVA